MEEDNSLLFLDMFVKRKLDGLLEHMVYRRPTHTDLYLHASSHHYPLQKVLFFPYLSDGPRSFVTPKALMEKSDISRRVRRSSTEP
jgi:hypothetical protein